MITKERLEELIEQDKVFYWVFNKEIRMLCNLSVPTYWKKNWELYGKDCFETKEEAEWHKEFGCIERTERLELPTWEEVKHDFIDNKQSAGNYCVVEFLGFQEYSLDIVVYNGDAMITISDEDFYEPLTKENYTLACRKAKELFLGEKK